jgi:hypothetical protein
MQGTLFPDSNPWRMVKDGNAAALALYLRHYSARMKEMEGDNGQK